MTAAVVAILTGGAVSTLALVLFDRRQTRTHALLHDVVAELHQLRKAAER